jgi:hypothetical protein
VCCHQLVERIDIPSEVLVDEFDISIGAVSHFADDGSHLRAISYRLSDVGFDFLNQRKEHSSQLLDLGFNLVQLRLVPVVEPDCGEYLSLKLTTRSIGNPEKPKELLWSIASAALGDIA